jgi:hypothetical protein
LALLSPQFEFLAWDFNPARLGPAKQGNGKVADNGRESKLKY